MIPPHLRFYKPMQPILLANQRKQISQNFNNFIKNCKNVNKFVEKKCKSKSKKQKEMDTLSTNSWVSLRKLD